MYIYKTILKDKNIEYIHGKNEQNSTESFLLVNDLNNKVYDDLVAIINNKNGEVERTEKAGKYDEKIINRLLDLYWA